MLVSITFMAKNERIIAQDLAEIKYSVQTQDFPKIHELCPILVRDTKKYPIKPNIADRLKTISDYCHNPSLVKPIDKNIKEINELIEILISIR